MVRLTDSDTQALALVGQGTLTQTQLDAVLSVFTHLNTHGMSNWAAYKYESLENAGATMYTTIECNPVCLSTTVGRDQQSIECIVRALIWSDITRKFDFSLEKGWDNYDYALHYKSKDTSIWGAFNFRLSRTPIEIID